MRAVTTEESNKSGREATDNKVSDNTLIPRKTRNAILRVSGSVKSAHLAQDYKATAHVTEQSAEHHLLPC